MTTCGAALGSGPETAGRLAHRQYRQKVTKVGGIVNAAYLPPPSSVVLDRVSSPHGELVLRQSGEHFEIISNGVFLMDTRNGESERLLVSLALRQRTEKLLIGGLGVGFSLDEALRHTDTTSVTVVEKLTEIVEWHRGLLREVVTGSVDDARVNMVNADLVAWLRATTQTFDAACLDIDNGPEWTVVDSNAWLYSAEGIRLLARCLHDDGVLTVWSSHRCDDFAATLRRAFQAVTVREVPVPRGEPDVVFIAENPLR